MSLARKMLQGGTTPNLYSFYGKQYDYNDLALTADLGLNEYLATLKRGEKDSDNFRTAYANIMAGIKDGSITFDNGQFHDSKGRYTNSDKKNKDYYGLIANYIYGKMGKSNVYLAPKDPSKIEWGDGSVKTALMRLLFNSDNGNVKDFLELDAEKNGVRSIANRSTYLSNALQSIADNWDNTFQGYLDADKSRYVPLLVNAAKALRDGTINPGDYLALSKAVGGMDFREMMATGTPIVLELPTQLLLDAPVLLPQIKTKHASLFDKSYDANTISRMTSIMAKIPPKGLINILRNSFYNRYYRFGSDPRISLIFRSSNISSKAGVTATLNALLALGVLQNADPNNPNLYYIPGLRTKKGTGWVWDKANNTVTEMLLENIPYAKAKLNPTYKNGGILFAGSGAKFYEGLRPFDQSGYQRTWSSTPYRINEKGEYEEGGYSIPGVGINNNRYKSDPNYSDFSKEGRERAATIENTLNYRNFTQRLLDGYKAYMNAADKSTQTRENNAFINYTRGYDAKLTNPELRFWDGDNLRTEWTASGNDYYGLPGLKIVGADKRITHLRTDNIIGGGHDNYRASGKRYFYKDENDTIHWVDPKDAESGKYTMKEGVKTTEGDTDWTDYELTGVTPNNPNSNTPNLNNGSAINPTQQPESKPNWFQQNGLKLAQDIAPLAVGAGRLFDSLHTNNKVADVVKKSIKPVLKNTYELYSPVTGAFSEMLLRNRQAADVRRQAALPYTSDASLNAARSLDANRLATDLQYLGFLADDKEILRTKLEALKRLEDNIARRTDTANFNRASINLANREIAQIEAGRLKSNWQSRDNFLSGVESDLKYRNAQRDYDRRVELAENRLRSLALDIDDINRPYTIEARNRKLTYDFDRNKLANEFDAKLANWQKINGDADYTSQPFYIDYIQKQRDLLDLYNKDSDDIAVRLSKDTRQYVNSLRTKMNLSTLFRKGGKLSPSTINLLYKVIK